MSTTANKQRPGGSTPFAPLTPVRLALAGFTAVEHSFRAHQSARFALYRHGEVFSEGPDLQQLVDEALEFLDAHERLTKGR